MNAIACRIRLALVIPLLTLPISNGTVAYSVEPPATALAFTSDGTVLVAGSQAGVLCYDWPDLTHPRNLNTHVANVQDLTFSPSQRYLAIAGGQPAESGVCEIVAWPEGHTVCTLESHQDVVCSAAWAPSSRTIATASMDTKVVVTTFEPAIRAQRGTASRAICIADHPQSTPPDRPFKGRIGRTFPGQCPPCLDDRYRPQHSRLAVDPAQTTTAANAGKPYRRSLRTGPPPHSRRRSSNHGLCRRRPYSSIVAANRWTHDAIRSA